MPTPTLIIDTVAAYLRLLWVLTLALLQFPIQAVLNALEWVVEEVLARLVVLPYLFVLHARRHVVEAGLHAEHRIQLARARNVALPTTADAAARLAHLEQVLAIIHDADRVYAWQDPMHPLSTEATRSAFETAMRGLHDVAMDPDEQAHLGTRVAELFASEKRSA